MSEATPMLELRRVSMRYDSPGGGPAVQVLRDVDLRVQAGETLAVTGPSGSGKSTLLNVMGALETPSQGQVAVEGEDLSSLSDPQLARLRNQRIGFVFQLHHLLPQCTVMENILAPALAFRRRVPDAVVDRARELLARVDLAGRARHRPAQLSGGERQRAALVRALINRPRLLLADEPTGSLDRAGAETLARLLVELNEEQALTLVVVTHSTEVARHMRRQFSLTDGRLVQTDGAPA